MKLYVSPSMVIAACRVGWAMRAEIEWHSTILTMKNCSNIYGSELNAEILTNLFI